jgi:hypothetical protein
MIGLTSCPHEDACVIDGGVHGIALYGTKEDPEEDERQCTMFSGAST